jgi:Zinc carboxypeptidase
MMKKNKFAFAWFSVCFLTLTFFLPNLHAQTTKIPEPKDVIGFTPGDDRKLASWNQILEYFQKLEDTSPRVKFETIGKTTLDKPFVYATISTPANLKNLEKYKQINAKLADPRLIKSNQKLADDLIKQGKTIVLITCGIHSTEVGSTLSSMLIAHKLATSNEPEIQKILENTIILLVPSLNPDGVDIVKNWYDKTLGTPYEGTDPPELYHKYVGHDNNRDWYAFTQVETQLTVDKIHNEWHPQIVHDIHQQGANGARLFLPPYLAPVEPNVPKEIVEGYTELGNYMANDLRKKGLQGITTDSTYDAWTPARAYSHYHGGVRILSETASAKLATPITVKYEDLRNGLGYDVRKDAPNFSPVWKGGEWKLRDITNYMTSAAFSLLNHAADNRQKWLTRFYAIGKEAVRPRKDGELLGYVIEAEYSSIEDILLRAGVELEEFNRIDGRKLNSSSYLVKMAQPYGAFAKAVLELQKYPDLKDENGNPISPYDVTAHSLPLLTNTKVYPVFKKSQYQYFKPTENGESGSDFGCIPKKNPYGLYKSHIPLMDEGWTRWILERSYIRILGNPCEQGSLVSINNELIKENQLFLITPPPAMKGVEIKPSVPKYKTIIFPDQSPNQILNGYPKGAMPDEYTGGIGKDGVANLKKFVEDGGTLVFLNRASDFAIEQFNLPVKDVTKGLPRKDFYIPGSILRTEIDTKHPIAKGMPTESIAWFEDSPAFEIQTDPLALTNNFKIIARYPSKPENILLSGWALGAEKLAGKAALVEFTIGKGKIILFGFRPQYRGQSLATFPLLFNAISN